MKKGKGITRRLAEASEKSQGAFEKNLQRQEILEQATKRDQQVDTTLNEIIDTIEKYFAVAPWLWIEGPAGEPGSESFPDAKSPFNRFDAWFDKWLCELFPRAEEAQRNLDAAGTDTSDAAELAFAAQELGFVCGMLVGCKTRGATREELLKHCDGLLLP